MHSTSGLRFNKSYEHNAARILQASRRGGGLVGDSDVIQPMVYPMRIPMGRPFAGPLRMRRMGETAVESQRFGNPSLWISTPLEKNVSVGDPDIVFDAENIFSNWEEVGFSWNFQSHTLEVYLTRDGQTYRVKLPIKKVYGLFASALDKHCADCLANPTVGAIGYYPASAATEAKMKAEPAFAKARLDAITQGLKSYVYQNKTYVLPKPIEPKYPLSAATARKMSAEPAFARARDGAIKAGKTSYTYKGETFKLPQPPRNCGDFFSWFDCAVKDVGKEVSGATKWVDSAVKDLGQVVNHVGKAAMDVASSPIFGGIMGAMAVIPPLSAVGGLGLAGFAAANSVKVAMKAIDAVGGAVKGGEAVIKTLDGVAKKVDVAKAEKLVGTFAKNVSKLGKPGIALIEGALESVPYTPPKGKVTVRAVSDGHSTRAAIQVKPVKGGAAPKASPSGAGLKLQLPAADVPSILRLPAELSEGLVRFRI